MMKTTVLTLLFLFCMNTYNSQTPSVLKDFSLNTPTLDLKVLNENKRDYTFYLTDSINVHQEDWGENLIKEEITRKNDPYSIVRIYYYPSGKIGLVKKQFYFFDIGTTRLYDENGKLEKEENNDYGYTFSVEDLTRKMWEKYKVDLVVFKIPRSYDPFPVYVSRADVKPGEKNPKTEYTVGVAVTDTLYRDGGRVTRRSYTIDGKTGKTLKIEEVVFMGEIMADYKGKEISCEVYHKYTSDGKGVLMHIREYKGFSTLNDHYIIVDEKILYKKQGYKEGVYKTYKGKNYTQEEWETFVEKDIQQYAKKHNIKLEDSDPEKKGGKFFLGEKEWKG